MRETIHGLSFAIAFFAALASPQALQQIIPWRAPYRDNPGGTSPRETGVFTSGNFFLLCSSRDGSLLPPQSGRAGGCGAHCLGHGKTR